MATFENALNDCLCEYLLKGDVCRFKVASESMRPLLRAGDTIVVEQWPAQDVHCGDILVFMSNGEICTHRCLRVFKTADRITYLTKGDAALQVDEIVDSDDLIGKVTVIERGPWRLQLPQTVDQVIGMIMYGIWRLYECLRRIKRVVVRYG